MKTPHRNLSEFLPVPGAPGRMAHRDGTIINSTGRVMKGTIVLGYRAVYAPDVDSGKKVQKVHRMVAATFLGGPTDKTEVNHKDGNKLNNAVSNLEWVTRQENMSHAWTNGHCAGVKLTRTGTGQGVKLTREMATRLQDAYAAGASLASLARDFSISYQHASSVAKRKSWA